MKCKWMRSAAVVAGVIFAANVAMAEVKWVYDSAAKTLTGIPSEGETATVFNLTDAGELTQKAKGTQKVIDLRSAALPSGMPSIKKMGKIRGNNFEALYMPETVEEIADGFCNFKSWELNNLKAVYFPDEIALKTIPYQAFYYSKVTNVVVLSKGIREIGKEAFVACAAPEIHLPSKLEIIRESAFSSCAAQHIEPCIPGSVTNIGIFAFVGCSMTNEVRVGFGKNEKTGEPLWVEFEVGENDKSWAFSNAGSKSIKFGPGVRHVPRIYYTGSWEDNLESVELGENVRTLNDVYQLATKMTNFVSLATNDLTILDHGDVNYATFRAGTLKEVTLNGWLDFSCGSGYIFPASTALTMRFLVPGNNVKWAAFIADETKVLPWAKCSSTDKSTYTKNFGADAVEPAGITIEGPSGYTRVYIVTNQVGLTGSLVKIGECAAGFGTVECTPRANEKGLYTEGENVTIRFVPEAGVTFTGWEGDVAEEDKMKEEIVVAASGVKNVKPTFTANYLVYDEEANELTDGQWVAMTTGTREALTVGNIKRLVHTGITRQNLATAEFTMDLTMPILGGGTIVGINQLGSLKAYLKGLTLPTTLRNLGYGVFRNYKLAIEPFLPDSVTNVEADAFVETAIAKNFRLGFAKDDAGNVIETKIGNQMFLRGGAKTGPKVELGPGIYSIPISAFNQGSNKEAFGSSCEEALDMWIGENVTNGAAAAMLNIGGTNKAVTIHYQGDMFDGSSGMFFNKVLENKVWTSWGAELEPYRMRFYVGADGCRKWHAFLADTTKVTPWASLDKDIQAKYLEWFPEATFGKKRPYGLTTDAAVMTNGIESAYGLPANQWVFSLKASGFVLRVQ